MTTRTLARLSIALFGLSTAFPIVAAIAPPRNPLSWLGVADVTVAALLVVSAFTVVARTRSLVTDSHRLAAFRGTLVLLNVVPLLLAGYFFLGTPVNWTVLIIGLAWRGWLFVVTLPNLMAAQATQTGGFRP